jgi:hypothetical protein
MIRVVLLAAVAALALASAAAAAGYKPPRTAHGDPDLQGVWTNSSLTTLERPATFKSQALKPEEAKAAEAAFQADMAKANAPSDPNAGVFTDGQADDGYNRFWLDLGSKFAVVNGEIRTSWVVEPADGKVPYSAEARSGMFRGRGRGGAFDGPEVRSLGERCIVGYGSSSGPPMLNVLYNNNYQIVQSPGYVTIVVEMNHDARVVRLNDRHLPGHITPWMGDSIGWWEGDTLVVETTNLNPGQSFTADVRHYLYLPPTAKVTERFTRVAKDEILYQFKVEDAKAYTQAWKGEIPMRTAKGPLYEYACHEGNYALPGILRGARAEESKAATPAAGGSE